MPDPLVLQVAGRLEQVVAEDLQVIDGQPALAAQVLGECLLPGLLQHQERAVPGVVRAVDEPDDVRVMDVAQLRGLVCQALSPGLVEGDLQHLLLAVLMVEPGHEEGSGGGALAEDLLHPPVLEDGALAGLKEIR